MTSISTRSSLLSIMEESTEGTPVVPASASSYIAQQEGFTMSPSTNLLTTTELKGSIGASKAILGSEAPNASLSHYIRGSGTAGTAPNYGLLLKSAFGSVVAASTEYDTASSSTTSVIKMPSGEGVNFQRGQALLIKDPTNGYRIRAIDSVATDDLNIGFEVPTAPGSGVNLGKAVLYKPANEGHPTLTVWNYVGNGGAIQMMAGARVTDITINISAGELINGDFSLEGIGYYFNPINILSADRYLDFTDDDGTWAAVVTAKMYKDPHELAAALQTAMAAANPLQTPTVTYSDTTGKFTIKTSGTVLSLLWNSGSNTSNTIGDKIGFAVAADDTGTAATTGYTSDNAISYAAAHTPSYDSADPIAAKNNEVMLGDAEDYLCFEASSVSVSIGTPKSDISSVCAESGLSGSIVSQRTVTVSVTALLNKYDVDKYRRYRANDNCKFQYSFGEKSGGNWVAGKCGCVYMPTATVSSYNVTDQDGLATLELELTGYVNSSGEGEIYINTL